MLIALIIPWVDVLSVWRGPTEYIVSEQPSLFDRVSIAFRLPGEEGSANIGPPDILFFSLFLSRPPTDSSCGYTSRGSPWSACSR